MNTQMWENPFVRDNLARIRSTGGSRFHFVEPSTKRLACGEHGIGALATAEEIVHRVREVAGRRTAS